MPRYECVMGDVHEQIGLRELFKLEAGCSIDYL